MSPYHLIVKQIPTLSGKLGISNPSLRNQRIHSQLLTTSHQPHLGHAHRPMSPHTRARRQRPRDMRPLFAQRQVRARLDIRLLHQALELRRRPLHEDVPRAREYNLQPRWRIWHLRDGRAPQKRGRQRPRPARARRRAGTSQSAQSVSSQRQRDGRGAMVGRAEQRGAAARSGA